MSKGLAFFIPTKTVVVIGAIISFSALLFFPKWQVSNAKLTDEKRIELENALGRQAKVLRRGLTRGPQLHADDFARQIFGGADSLFAPAPCERLA